MSTIANHICIPETTMADIAILSHAGMCSMSSDRMFELLKEIYAICEAAGFNSAGMRDGTPVSRK
jgi:hypothetical protein